MSRSPRPSPTLAGAVLLGGLSLSTSALAMTDLTQGYALGAQASTPPQTEDPATPPTATPTQSTAHIEHDQKTSAKSAEGKCGAHTPATADSKKKASKAAAKHGDKAMTEGKCGEGKCGGGG